MRSAVIESGQTEVLQASLLVGLSGILYGFLGYFGTCILQEKVSLLAMLFWRFFIAGIWMLLCVLKQHVQNKSTRMGHRALVMMFLLGALTYATSSGFYFMASRYIGTGLAMVIFFSFPVVVAILSWFLHGKKISAWMIMMLALMMGGLFLLQSSMTHVFSLLGILLALSSAVFYGIYVMGCKRYATIAIDSRILTMMVCFGCAIFFMIAAISTHQFILPITLRSWMYILLLGIGATAIPAQLMLEGLKHVSSLRASIISVLEPTVTVIVGIIFLHEAISLLQMLGGMMVIGSALLIQFQKEL